MGKYLVALDAGHSENTAGKRTPPIPELGGRVIRENEFNLAVVKFIAKELKRCEVDTLIVSDINGKVDTTLQERCDKANKAKADVYVSVHYNALDGRFDGNDPEGITVYIYTNTTKSEPLAKAVHKYLIKGTNQKNRGIQRANFKVLRSTKMPAILTENGFMDNKREALLMANVDFQKEVAREHAMGICEYLGVKYVEEVIEPVKPVTDNLYRVRKEWKDAKSQKGAFANLENAKELADDNKDYKVFDKNGKQVYPVIREDFLVRVTADGLNIRQGAGTSHKVVGTIRNKGTYTIVETNGNWGKLKSGAGWIHLGYTERV